MRNPDRIDPILAQIRDLWVKYPDLRLGQLLVVLVRPKLASPEVFYIEDDVLSNRLETLADEMVDAPSLRESPYRHPPKERDPDDIDE